MPRLLAPGRRRGLSVVVAVVLASLLASCYGYTDSDNGSDSYDDGFDYSSDGGSSISGSCESIFASALQRVRTGDTAGTINSEIDWLAGNCSSHYDTLIGYASTRDTINPGSLETCEVWSDRVGLGAAELLWEDGLCVPESEVAADQPGGGLSWDQAAGHVGEFQRVCGPLMSARTWGDDVFLNIGRDYPDASRFTMVIWDIGGLEYIEPGATLCAEEVITSYEGVAQFELYDPAQVEIWR